MTGDTLRALVCFSMCLCLLFAQTLSSWAHPSQVVDSRINQWSILTKYPPGFATRGNSVYNNSIFLFPERYINDWDQDTRIMDRTYILKDLSTFEWDLQWIAGDAPPVRDDYCTAAVGNKIYLFGGITDAYMDDFYVLDVFTFTWTRIARTPSAWPSARRFPLCFERDGYFHVYSGLGSVESTNDMWKYIPGRGWQRIGYKSQDTPGECYSIFGIHDNTLYTYSGMGGDGTYNYVTYDFWGFSFDTLVWTKYDLDYSLSRYLPGAYTSAYALIGDILYFSHGIHNFMDQTAQPTMVGIDVVQKSIVYFKNYTAETETYPYDATCPMPRSFTFASKLGNQFVLLGGEATCADDSIWTFNAVTQTWDSSSLPFYPISRQYPSVMKLSEDSFAFYGGVTQCFNVFSMNDLWTFTLSTNKWVRLFEQKMYDSSNPKAYAPPAAFSTLSYYSDYLYVIGGEGLEFYPDGITYRFHIPSKTWEWLNIDPAAAHLGFMTQQATYTVGSTIIFWGGVYVPGFTGTVDETKLVFYDMKTNTAEIYEGSAGMQTRIQASGFMLDNRFCIQGGMDTDNNPVMDILCFDKGQQKWAQLENSGAGVEQYMYSSFINVGAGLLIGGEDLTNTYSPNIWIYNYDTSTWGMRETAQNRPPPFKMHRMITLNNWIVVIGTENEQSDDPRVFGYDMGKMFCDGEVYVDAKDGVQSISDGSGSFGYMPFTKCAWRVANTNNLVVSLMDTDSNSVVDIQSLNTCGDHSIYVDEVDSGSHVGLSFVGKGVWLKIPGSSFLITLETSNKLVSKGGFELDSIYCPNGFDIVDLACVCRMNKYITPSGECFPCEEGFYQNDINKHYCVNKTESVSQIAHLDVATGSWDYGSSSLPSCLYSASASSGTNVYIICMYSTPTMDETQTIPVVVVNVKSPISLSFDVPKTMNPPPSRKGACAIFFNGKIYYIGGRSPTTLDLSTYVLSLDDYVWTKNSAAPFNLAGFAYARKDSIVYVHGGENTVGNGVSSVYSYDLDTDKWEAMAFESSPSLSYHIGWISGNSLVLFGGYDGTQELDFIYKGDLSSKKFASPQSVIPDSCLTCASKSVIDCQLPRQMMTYTESNGNILIYGGIQTDTSLRDLLVFEKDTLVFSLRNNYGASPPLPENAPPQVYMGTMSPLDGYIMLFGGIGLSSNIPGNYLWTYDPDRDTWLSSTSVQKPLERYGHAVTKVVGDGFAVFGGVVSVGDEYTTNDMWLYNITTNKWALVVRHTSGTATISPRAYGTITYHEGFVYAFGGTPNLASDAGNMWRIRIQEIIEGQRDILLAWELVKIQNNLLSSQHLLERSGFSGVVHKGVLWAWGGILSVRTGVIEDYRAVFMFDTQTLSLSTYDSLSTSPNPRRDHGAISTETGFCIHGGRDFKNRVLSDVWCFNTASRIWSMITSYKDATQVYRYGALAGTFGYDFVIYGGFDQNGKRTKQVHQYQLENKQWVELTYTSSMQDTLRIVEHDGIFVDDKIFTFGGSTETFSLNSVSVMEPSLCSAKDIIDIPSSRQMESFEDSSGNGLYPAGTYCQYQFQSGNFFFINASISEGDSVDVYVDEDSGPLSLVTKISKSGYYTVSNPKRNTLILLKSPGKISDGLRGNGVVIEHINCPTGSTFDNTDCICPQNFYEDTASNECVKCSSSSSDATCPDSSSKGSPLVIGVGVGVSGGVIVLLAVFGYKKYKEKLDAISSKQKQLFMHVDFKDLEIGNLLGTGSFGEVYTGKWRSSDVAIKKLISTKLTKEAIREFEAEVGIMVELRHPNIVLYMAACVDPKNLCIVSELMTRGSLYDILHNEAIEIDESMRYSFITDAAKGLQYLHMSNPPILHKDLKSPNLLMDEKWNCKISDFGLTGVQSTREKDAAPPGTLLWMAPEVIRGEEYTSKCDIFSFGIIIWEVLSREEPYAGELAESVALRVANGELRPEFLPSYQAIPDLQALAEQCWAQEPADRPNFGDMLQQLKSKKPEFDTLSMLSSSSIRNPRKPCDVAPTGTVALVFTDIQSSTSLWEKYPQDMFTVLSLHNDTIREAIKRNKGYEVKTEGDAFIIAFDSAVNAVNFALHTQELLVLVDWPSRIFSHPSAGVVRTSKGILFRGVRVRMGIHVGIPLCREDPTTGRMDYYGPVVNTAARIGSFPQGGQVVIGEDVYNAICNDLDQVNNPVIRDLGLQELKGLPSLEHLYEITPEMLRDRSEHFASHTSANSLGVVDTTPTEGASGAEATSWQLRFEDIKMSNTELGSGSYGVVFLGEVAGSQVAVKKFIRQKMAEKQLYSLMSEVILMREIQHTNIIRFHGACLEQPNLCIVLEYAPFGSLRKYLADQTNIMAPDTQKSILHQIAGAMRYLHSREPPIYHRDLKSENVLITRTDPVVAKIGDFGLARVKANNQTMTKCGTKAWIAPEILRGIKYNEKADVYSFGILTWEVASRQKPYTNVDPLKLAFEVTGGLRPAVPKNMGTTLAALMKRCWDGDPEKRPSFSAIETELS